MGLATGAIITGILGGLFAGHTAAYSKKKQLEAQNEQIEFQKGQLNDQKSYLTQQYNNTVKWTNYQFGQSMSQGNDTIATYTTNRDISAIENAQNIYSQNKQEIEQLNNTIANYTAQQGQLDSYVNNSGFRNTEGTTKSKYTEQVRSNIDNAVNKAIETIQLNANQRFLQSRMSYIESSKNIESYQNQLKQIQAQTEYSLKTQQEEYEYKKDSIDKQIGNLDKQIISSSDINLMTAFEGINGMINGFNSFSGLVMNLFGK